MNNNRLLNDNDLYLLCTQGMLSPFEPNQVRADEKGDKVISYGLSSYGYDVRIGDEFFIPSGKGQLVDPKDDRSIKDNYKKLEYEKMVNIPPNGFILGHTVETFDVPDNVFGICIGKSTYARLGLDIMVSPVEPGFKGQVVIEIANTTPNYVRIYPNEGICQFIFFRSDRPSTNYSNRPSKYQNQLGVTLPKV